MSTSNCCPHVGAAPSTGDLVICAVGHRRSSVHLCSIGPFANGDGRVVRRDIPGFVGRRIVRGDVINGGGVLLPDSHSNCVRLCLCSVGNGLVHRMRGNGCSIATVCNVSRGANSVCFRTTVLGTRSHRICITRGGNGIRQLASRRNSGSTCFSNSCHCFIGG